MAEEGQGHICTVCQDHIKGPELPIFHQAPVCSKCWDDLELGSIEVTGEDSWLIENIDASGREVEKGFTAIASQYPKDYGWNILAIINTIGETVENPQQRSMLEQSALLAGASTLRNGKEEGEEPDPRLLSLYLVLGQFLVLSIMKRIVSDKGLRTGKVLDEVKLIGDFNRKVFDLLLGLDPGEDEKLENVLAQALSRVV